MPEFPDVSSLPIVDQVLSWAVIVLVLANAAQYVAAMRERKAYRDERSRCNDQLQGVRDTLAEFAAAAQTQNEVLRQQNDLLARHHDELVRLSARAQSGGSAD